MTDEFAVDLDELDRCIASLDSLNSFIAGRLDELNRRVDGLQSVWVGDAAEAAHYAHQQWMAGAQEMQLGLRQLAQAAAASHQNYSAAIAANARMWP